MAFIEREEAVELVESPSTVTIPQIAELSNIHEQLDFDKRIAELAAEERSDLIKMREKWSKWILRCIVFIVVADFILIFGLGIGKIQFPSNNIVPIFIAESIVKIVGLAYIVVGFLFNKDSLGRGDKNR